MGFSLSDITDNLGAIGGALIGGIPGAIVGSGVDGFSSGRSDAARAGIEGQLAGINELRRQYDLTRGDLLPSIEAGNRARSQIEDILAGKVDFSQDPLLQNQFSQAAKGAGRFASAGGTLGTGGYNKNLLRGTQEVINSRINQLLGLAGAGQNAATSAGGLGANTASQIAGSQGQIGQLQAAPYLSRANTLDQLLQLGAGFGLSKLL